MLTTFQEQSRKNNLNDFFIKSIMQKIPAFKYSMEAKKILSEIPADGDIINENMTEQEFLDTYEETIPL